MRRGFLNNNQQSNMSKNMTTKQLRKQKKRKKQKLKQKEKNRKTQAKNIRNNIITSIITDIRPQDIPSVSIKDKLADEKTFSTMLDMRRAKTAEISPDEFYECIKKNKAIMEEDTEVVFTLPRQEGKLKIVVSRDFEKYEDEMIVLSYNNKFGYIKELVTALWNKNAMYIDLRVGFYLFEENTMIGFAISSVHSDSFFVEFILIAEKYRRKGYGKDLLRQIFCEGGNRDVEIKCEIDPSNIIAKKFFIKNNFKLDTSDNVRKNHYEQYTACGGYEGAVSMLFDDDEKKKKMVDMLNFINNSPRLKKAFLESCNKL